MFYLVDFQTGEFSYRMKLLNAAEFEALVPSDGESPVQYRTVKEDLSIVGPLTRFVERAAA